MIVTILCPTCGHESTTIYRCDACGRDLVETDRGVSARGE